MLTMALVRRLRAVCIEKSSILANEAPRFAKSRARRQKWAALAAPLILAVCFAHPRTAQAADIQVNTTQQGVSNGQCSLQEAIYSSEFKLNIAVDLTDPDHFVTTGCAPGTGNDTIWLVPTGAVFTFDHFWDGDAHNIYGPTATPVIFSTITIMGNGATLQWASPFGLIANTRLFAVGTVNDPTIVGTVNPGFVGTGNLTLMNVYVKGFRIKGGDGGSGGGGGGLGAGGAIYVDTGSSLTVANSTFENNGAVGGNGGGKGDPTSEGGGGGGGLSGNGGDVCAGAGGGGGSRGNGGKGACGDIVGGGGGGGGGTAFSGADGAPVVGGPGGFLCGGNGGDKGHDGHEAACPGGGGGGGGDSFGVFGHGSGKDGSYGGGGGGGAGDGGNGGNPGGGGGAGTQGHIEVYGGHGGFGGGGGAAPSNALRSKPGDGGEFGGGRADGDHGGGGGALGGAIFSYGGNVQVQNSTFFNNYVTRGVAGGGSADNGADAGGAIFSYAGPLEITDFDLQR